MNSPDRIIAANAAQVVAFEAELGLKDLGDSSPETVDRASHRVLASLGSDRLRQFWATLGHPLVHSRALVEKLEDPYHPS